MWGQRQTGPVCIMSILAKKPQLSLMPKLANICQDFWPRDETDKGLPCIKLYSVINSISVLLQYPT